MTDEGNEEREERESRRPRVVDKRVSTRPPGESPPSTEPAGADAPPKEPIATPPPAPEPTPDPRPESQQSEPAAPGVGPPPGPPGAGGERVWTPEEEAEARRAAQEMATVPARDWVLNVAVTLANVAGIKLQDGQFEDAQLAIDAFAGMIDKIETQMGDAGPVLRQTLAQLQMAYAQAVAPPPQPPAQ